MQRLPTLLERDEPTWLQVVLGEAAVQLRVGDEQVMVEQMAHLRKLAELPTVSVKILTHGSGPHPALLGGFSILDFEDEADPSVTYVQSYAGARYNDQEALVQQHRAVFEAISKQATPLEEYRA